MRVAQLKDKGSRPMNLKTTAKNVLKYLDRGIGELEVKLADLRAKREAASILDGNGKRGRPAGQTNSGTRVDWSAILEAMPQRFAPGDVAKNPAAASKGRAQIYPAIARWLSAGLVRRIEDGNYEKTGGSRKPKASKKAKPKPKARRSSKPKSPKPRSKPKTTSKPEDGRGEEG